MVGIGFSFAAMRIPCVCTNHTRSMHIALENLYQLGYRHVALALTGAGYERTDYAELGAVEPARQKGYGPRKFSVFGLKQAWCEKNFSSWYYRTRPEVIIVGGRREVWRWINKLKIAVPDELGYVELMHRAEARERSFAGVDPNLRLVGATAAELVVAQIERNERGVPDHPHAPWPCRGGFDKFRPC